MCQEYGSYTPLKNLPVDGFSCHKVVESRQWFCGVYDTAFRVSVGVFDGLRVGPTEFGTLGGVIDS